MKMLQMNEYIMEYIRKYNSIYGIEYILKNGIAYMK